MELRTIMYSFASPRYLKKRVERNGVKLETEPDSRKRKKIIDDEFCLLKAIIRKNRKDKEFMDYARRSINNFVMSNAKW